MAGSGLRGRVVSRQDRADAVDWEMATRLLPDAALQALGRWWSGNSAEFADGTPGAHTVRYTPGRWAQITPWPSALASTSHVGDAGISRAQVASIVADAVRREAFREALVATYVWGKGKRGSPSGSGPSSLQKILTAESHRTGPCGHHVERAQRKSCLRGAPGPRSRVRSVVLHQVPLLRRQDGSVGNRPPAARPRPGSGPASAVPGPGGRPRDRPRPRRLDRQLGLARYELVTAPLRGLPLLHEGGRRPSSSNEYLAVRRLVRPARIRPVQRLVDMNRRLPATGESPETARGRAAGSQSIHRRRSRASSGCLAQQLCQLAV